MTERRLDSPHHRQASAMPPGSDTAGALTFQDWLMVLIAASAGGIVAAVLVPHWLTELSHTLMGQKPRVFWYLGRASAFVSYLLLWLSMMLGLMMTSKLARAWPGGAIAQDLHQSASLMGLVFGVFHAFILMGSRFLHYDVLDVLVPFRSDVYRTTWVGMGQVAIYGMAAVGLSFYVRRKITQRFWRLIHFLSFAVFVLILAHGLQAGSDADTPVVKALYWVTAGSVLCLTVHRVLSRLADRAAGAGFAAADAGGTAAPPVHVALTDARPSAHSPRPAGAPVAILFGSQSGNAETLAGRAANMLAKEGVPAVAMDAARFRPEQLAQTQRLIIITSTCGEGEPPDNITGLYRHLHASAAPGLAHLEYAVLALGDSSYATFCKAGRDFDARLAALGARRLCDLVACDTDYEPSYQAWIAQAIQAFRTGPAQDAAPAVTPGPARVAAPVAAPVAAATERDAAVSEAMPASGEQESYSRTRPFMAQIVRNESLHAGINLTGRQTRHIVFSLRGSGLTYEPGDALGVWPANRLSLVAEVIRAAGLPKDAAVKLPDGGSAPLVDALLRHYDISRLTRAHVECFAERSRDPALRRLLDGTNADALKDYCRGRDLIDLLQDHPRLFGDAGEFVAMLRKLNPRLYSISSSQKMCPDEVHLTVGVLRYDSNGRRRYGVCSNDLAQARQHATRPIFVQPNKTFRLPADARAPVIMVGPGTGIAPFRGFLQERAAAGARGKNWLFFGCQHARSDFLYREELELFRARGVLARLDTAFSRDQAEKIYVQNLINQNATELWRWLDEGAYFYVCGDAARMAKDVDQALHDVAIQAGGLSAEKAREWAATLRQQKRYLRDVY